MPKRHIYYIPCEMTVHATVLVLGETEDEARKRLDEGAWHGILNEDWDHSYARIIGQIVKGPGISPS